VGQIFVILSVHYGAGRHIDDLKPADFEEGFKLNFITQPLYLWAICLAKVSIGFFLLRVAVTHFYRRIIMGIMGESHSSMVSVYDHNVRQSSWPCTRSDASSLLFCSVQISQFNGIGRCKEPAGRLVL
jgi:hypothetical protein